MEITTAIISFLEKHISWRCLLALICISVSFWFGVEYNNASRNREESKLILEHAKEITAYHDSALSAKQEAHDAIINYKWMMFQQARTIDSLKNVIKMMSDENKN